MFIASEVNREVEEVKGSNTYKKKKKKKKKKEEEEEEGIVKMTEVKNTSINNWTGYNIKE